MLVKVILITALSVAFITLLSLLFGVNSVSLDTAEKGNTVVFYGLVLLNIVALDVVLALILHRKQVSNIFINVFFVISLLLPIKSESSLKETSLVIDDKAYRAYFEGKDLSLTVSEFLLLKTLHDLPNQVLSREQLILSIFNEDYIGNDRIIDAHIKNLRKKLPVNVIDTVIGVGYRWKED